MASPIIHSGEIDAPILQRSRSRIYYESDCSSPTSWEFRGLRGSPVPMSGGMLSLHMTKSSSPSCDFPLPCVNQVHGGSSSSSSSPQGDLRADGSRNSTGSSSGSHRSQDSGFSDSGETRASRRNATQHQHQISPGHRHMSLYYSGNHGHSNGNHSHFHPSPVSPQDDWKKTPSMVYISPIPSVAEHKVLAQQEPIGSTCRHTRYSSTPVVTNYNYDVTTTPRAMNCSGNGCCQHYTPHVHHSHSRTHCRSHSRNSMSQDPYGTMYQHQQVIVPEDTLYQEIVLAQSSNSTGMSPLPEASSMLGTPACCSTPKLKTNSTSRIGIVHKIDNFESLNKNKISLDGNNNSNNNQNGSRNSMLRNHSAGTSVERSAAATATARTTVVLRPSSYGIRSTEKSLVFHNSNSLLCATVASSSVGLGHSAPNYTSSSVSAPHLVYSTRPAITKKQLSESSCGLKAHAGPVIVDEVKKNDLSNYASHPKLFLKNEPKWQTLPRGYKRVPAPGNLNEHIIVKSHYDNDSVRLWLHELRVHADSECLTTLQTKAIPYGLEWNVFSGASKDLTSLTARSERTRRLCAAIHSVSIPLMSIRNVERMASVISGEFASICKHLEYGMFFRVPGLVLSLVGHIKQFLQQFREPLGFMNLNLLEERLATSCLELGTAGQMMATITSQATGAGRPAKTTETDENGNCHNNTDGLQTFADDDLDFGPEFHTLVTDVVEGIVSLGNLFSQVVDLRLTRDMSSLLYSIEQGGIPARIALKSLALVLSDGGMHMCRLASELCTVRELLSALLDSREEIDKMLCLRCLATILCVGEAVKDFDKAGGFEIIADMLYDPKYSFTVKVEAASVLTQATDPWIDLETTLASLGVHLEKIIESLAKLIVECHTEEEPFLLIVAAISNLTFLEVASLQILRRNKTVHLIIEAVRRKPDFSIFVLDHVATILANMAGIESCRDAILRAGGIVILLAFLQKRPLPGDTAAEVTACERVQQKSTIAISRLCNEYGVAQYVMEKGGIDRLIHLCRQEKERNFSDGVLIACLATLRKLVSECGEDVIVKMQAEDLIQPRLLDSFLMYSSRQESYV